MVSYCGFDLHLRTGISVYAKGYPNFTSYCIQFVYFNSIHGQLREYWLVYVNGVSYNFTEFIGPNSFPVNYLVLCV